MYMYMYMYNVHGYTHMYDDIVHAHVRRKFHVQNPVILSSKYVALRIWYKQIIINLFLCTIYLGVVSYKQKKTVTRSKLQR